MQTVATLADIQQLRRHVCEPYLASYVPYQLSNFTDIHAITAIRLPEKYENLAEGFRDMFTAINSYVHTPFLTINGNIYTVEFFLCADYKVCPMLCMYCKLQLCIGQLCIGSYYY